MLTLRHCPVEMFQDFIKASAPAEYKIFPRASVAIVVTAPEWPLNIFKQPPVSKDQDLAVESADPEIKTSPGLITGPSSFCKTRLSSAFKNMKYVRYTFFVKSQYS